MTSRLRLSASVIVGLLALAMLTGCGGTKAAPPKAKSAAERLATAQKFYDDSAGVKITLSTPKVPRGSNGILTASGLGTKTPAFKGTIKAVLNGFSGDVPVIAVNGDVYIRLFGAKFQKIDPATFGAPDPALLVQKGGGLSQLMSAAEGAKPGKDVRDGSQVLSTITATVSGATAKQIVPSAGSGDFAVSYSLDDADHLVSAKVTGPFFGKTTVTYTIDLSDYGTVESIKAP